MNFVWMTDKDSEGFKRLININHIVSITRTKIEDEDSIYHGYAVHVIDYADTFYIDKEQGDKIIKKLIVLNSESTNQDHLTRPV
jgi:hypothetical protein